VRGHGGGDLRPKRTSVGLGVGWAAARMGNSDGDSIWGITVLVTVIGMLGTTLGI
jgi:hypothetical protein